MKLSVASNWDITLLDELANFPGARTVYAKLDSDIIGGGRPSYLLPKITKEYARQYVAETHRRGMKFNYLLNPQCLDNLEYTAEFNKKIIEELKWLSDIGVDYVTVSIPYLLQMIKYHFPHIQIIVSVFANINSVQKARFFQDLGADILTLPEYMNRDFKRLREIKKSVTCDIQLIANMTCLFGCPFQLYHANVTSHSSQSGHVTKGFCLDYCILNCTRIKITQPEELMKSRWIRPEDTQFYETLGIDSFKIIERFDTTETLTRTVRAYTEQKYDGNLADILNLKTRSDRQMPVHPGYFFHPEFADIQKLADMEETLYLEDQYIDNHALAGFIDFFESKDCFASSCEECGYCKTTADRVVKIEPRKAKIAQAKIEQKLNDFISGDIYRASGDQYQYPLDKNNKITKEKNKMEWQPEIYKLYEKVTGQVPEAYRALVKPLLHDTAEKKCLDRNASHVNEADLVTALLDITPDPFQAEAIANLRELGIDMQRYLELKKIRDRHKSEWEKIDKPWHPGNYWFTMYLTDRCNQRCLHCAADKKTIRPELSTAQWIAIVENLETSLRKKGRRGVYIWFGGEALCRDDIRDIIKYCGGQGYFHTISTNGMLFDEDIAAYCAAHGMSHVFISLDSTDPCKTDKIRGMPHSFDYAKKAIQNARKHGLLTVVTTTVMKYNIDELAAIKDFIESLDAVPYFRAVIKQKNAAENWEEIGLSRDNYKQFYDFKYRQVIDVIKAGKAGTLPIFGIYDMTPFCEHPHNDTELTALEWGVGCQACRSISGIDVNGDVFPCDYPSNLTIGNVLTQEFSDIMESQAFKDIRDRKRKGKCASCHHLSLCGGGCRVHAECETGDFSASFSYCWHEPK